VARFTGFCCSARCPRAWRVGSLSSSKGQNNLSLMLKRGIGVLAGAALVVALLAVLPAVAQAQEGRTPIQEAPVANRGADAASARVVVRPGDTLWSISSEQLGPNATPRQIANGVERIYALNQDQLGADPNMIEFIVTDDQYAARKLLGWVITLVSLGIGAFPLVLAIIRAARRKSRYRPVYGGRAYATPFAAFGNLYAEDDPQEATRSAPSEEHKPHTDSGNSTKGSDSLDDASRHATVTSIARSRPRRPLRTRNRGAGRPPRDPTVSGARQSRVPRHQHNTMNREAEDGGR
jgi:LysM repeat protein